MEARVSESSEGSFLRIFGILTGLQEALQLHRADEFLPVVCSAWNDAQQLLGYNNAQRVGQVGFINSGDEERTAGLHRGEREKKKKTRHTLPVLIRHHLGQRGIYRTDLGALSAQKWKVSAPRHKVKPLQRHLISGGEG